MFKTFGAKSLPEINDKASKSAIEKWKASTAISDCKEQLWASIDPHDPESKTYLQVIFEMTFPKKEDQENDLLLHLTTVVVERMLDPKTNVNMLPADLKSSIEVKLLFCFNPNYYLS